MDRLELRLECLRLAGQGAFAATVSKHIVDAARSYYAFLTERDAPQSDGKPVVKPAQKSSPKASAQKGSSTQARNWGL